jgi:NADPH:quinone reductase-like Zn-dependent oxidoreductase
MTAGAWGEYAVTDFEAVFPLEDHVSFEQAADLIVNPMTVAYMIEVCQKSNSGFIQNAAASSLGQQLTQLATRLGIKHINLVRRSEQVEILRALGAELVFNTSEPDWLDHAKKAAASFAPVVAFDAIGGKDTAVLGSLIENKGTVYNYGLLSGLNPELSSLQLIFQQKTLTGLWLRQYLFAKSVEERREVGRFVQKHIDILGFRYGFETNLSELRDALVRYKDNPTGNKVLIRTKLA